MPKVVAEREIAEIERRILGADLMERAENPALQEAPEPFNAVRVDRPAHAFQRFVIDDFMRQAKQVQPRISRAGIGRKEGSERN